MSGECRVWDGHAACATFTDSVSCGALSRLLHFSNHTLVLQQCCSVRLLSVRAKKRASGHEEKYMWGRLERGRDDCRPDERHGQDRCQVVGVADL